MTQQNIDNQTSDSDFYNSLNKNYNTIHRELQNKYAKGALEDEKRAKELESFFNYIVYGTDSKKLSFNKLLTKQLAQEIKRRNPQIGQQLFNKMIGAKQSDIGAAGEQGFASLIQEIVANISGNDQILNTNIVAGQDFATVAKIPQELAQQCIQQISQELQNSATELNPYYGKFQQKTDIKGLRGSISLSPDKAWLLDLSATVKNYQGNVVTLGKTTNIKVIRATIMSSQALSPTEKALMAKQLNALKSIRRDSLKDAKMLEHFNHISAIYELIGIGQVQAEDVSKGSEKPNFLMVNIRGGQGRIVVRSTRRLVKDILTKGKLTDLGLSVGSSGVHLKL